MRKRAPSRNKPELSFILFIPLIIILILIIILVIILIKRRRAAAAAANNAQNNIPQWQQNIINQNDTDNNNPNEQLRGAARLQHAQAIRQRALERAALARGENINGMDNVNENEENGIDGEENGEEEEQIHIKKIGKKKAERLRRKEQRQQYFQWVEAQKEHKRERERLREEDMKKRKAKEMKRIAKEEERELKMKEKLRKEEEKLRMELERLKMEEEERDRYMISKTSEIISFLENNSPISMEELASHFNFRVDKTRNFVNNLIENNNIFGVFDINDEYVNITQDELSQISQYILQLNSDINISSDGNKKIQNQNKDLSSQLHVTDRSNYEVYIKLCREIIGKNKKKSQNNCHSQEQLLSVNKENSTNYKLNEGDDSQQNIKLRKPWKGKEALN